MRSRIFLEACRYNNRAGAYWNMGEYQRAIEDYDRAIERDPQCGVLYLDRACAYSIARDLEHCLEDLKHAISLGGVPRCMLEDDNSLALAKRDPRAGNLPGLE